MRTATLRRRERSTDDRYLNRTPTRLDRALALPCRVYDGDKHQTLGWPHENHYRCGNPAPLDAETCTACLVAEVQACENASPPHKTGVFRKINRYGWEVVFTVPTAGPVTVARYYRGAPAGYGDYSVEKARFYYTSLTRQGFTSVGVGL